MHITFRNLKVIMNEMGRRKYAKFFFQFLMLLLIHAPTINQDIAQFIVDDGFL